MTLKVIFNDDDTITFEWDENDLIDSMFNTWTKQDFMDAILSYCKEIIGKEEYNRILDGSSVTFEDDTCTEAGEEPKV